MLIWCHVMKCDVIWYHVKKCDLICCHIKKYDVSWMWSLPCYLMLYCCNRSAQRWWCRQFLCSLFVCCSLSIKWSWDRWLCHSFLLASSSWHSGWVSSFGTGHTYFKRKMFQDFKISLKQKYSLKFVLWRCVEYVRQDVEVCILPCEILYSALQTSDVNSP